MKAIIVGAGIGGLTTALCLHRIGWQVEVLEQAGTLEDIGAGLQLSPNGYRVLEQLNVLPALSKSAFHPERIEMRLGKSGKQIFSIPLKESAEKRWGAAYVHIHRADLINALAGTLRAQLPDALQMNTAVTSYTQSASAITITLSTGETCTADLLVGADGIHSRVRENMLGPEAPQFTGNIAWRATVPIEQLGHLAPPPTACVWVGPNRHAVTYRLRGGKLANFVGVVEQQGWQYESWTEMGNREDALADFSGWHPVVTNIIDKADSHYRWALFDRPPLQQWHEGRAVLLGDACHPMLPFLAQGAVMSMEDAWVLADSLAKYSDMNAALTAYQSLRLTRTAKVQTGARANMKRFHYGSPLAYLPLWLVGKFYPGIIHARQDWLYGYDVVNSGHK